MDYRLCPGLATAPTPGPEAEPEHQRAKVEESWLRSARTRLGDVSVEREPSSDIERRHGRHGRLETDRDEMRRESASRCWQGDHGRVSRQQGDGKMGVRLQE